MNTALEMRELIQAFLKARSAVMPKLPTQRLQQVVQEESQEDYGEFSFDFNDPDFAAILDTADSEAGSANRQKEEETCKV
jgi:hypothetical protein